MEPETLLTPIDGDSPCGEDLSFSAEFDAILEARRADDPSLDQGEWVTDLKSADWSAVIRQSSRLLAERSKDLRLAVWYAEARARTDGFEGLAAGYRLLSALCERYWDSVHPLAEDDDHEQRVGNLAWLLANSVQWARSIPLVHSAQGSHGLAAFEAARARAVQAERDGEPEPDEPERPSLATLEKIKRDTPYEFHVRLMAALPDCLQALGELERSVDARLGHDGPSFSATRDALESILASARRFAGEAGVRGEVDTGAAPAAPPAASDGEAPVATPVRAPVGAISERREALAQLRRVAEFFRRTEPHSPVAYLADKAARWGDMPLHVWLRSVVKDEASIAQLDELLDVGTGDNE